MNILTGLAIIAGVIALGFFAVRIAQVIALVWTFLGSFDDEPYSHDLSEYEEDEDEYLD